LSEDLEHTPEGVPVESKLAQVSKPTLISGLFDREFKDKRTRYIVQCALKEIQARQG
jgi:hypothetical protein